MQDIEQIARVIICQNDNVLLCESLAKKHIFLPGGHIEEGETAKDALKREMQEETNSSISELERIDEFENEYDDPDEGHIVERFDVFLGKLSGSGEVRSKEDHLRFHWVPVDEVVNVNFKPRKVLPKILTIIELNREYWEEGI